MSQEVVFLFFFSMEIWSTILSPIIRHSAKKTMVIKGQRGSFGRQGLAPGFGGLVSTRIMTFFLGLEQALAFPLAPSQAYS